MAQRICTVEGCDTHVLALGYCGPHYRRNRMYGDPLAGPRYRNPKPAETCIVDGCERLRRGHGLCGTHLARHQRHGSATGGRASEVLGIERPFTPCSSEGCEDRAQSEGMCWAHLNRMRYLVDRDTWARHSAEYRARKVGATVERFTAAEILERDGWVCGICSTEIPRDAQYPDAQSPSIDHVLPLSRGGAHSRANTQASHLVCNKRKGARVG